jgi:putative transposase
VNRVELSEAEREQALTRFTLLRPHLEEGLSIQQLAADAGVSVRTVQRWVQSYREHGLAGLARKPRADRGHRKLPEDLVRLIEGLALRRPPPTAAAVCRQAETVARDQGWPVPSYRTVFDIVSHLSPGLVTLAHEGNKAYANTFDLIYRRTAERTNDIWQADHTLLDIWVLDQRDRPARPWLTAIMDDFSRAIAGYALNFGAPSALNSALALHQAIWRKGDPHWHVCGIPDIFYTDHGSDFTSRHLEQVAADIKMQLVFSTVGVPRGRGKIERFFETVNQLLLCQLPGYAPAGTPQPAPVLSLSDLDARVGQFIVEDYNQRLHSETGSRPQERWMNGAFIPRLPETLEELDLLLLTVPTARQVHPDGIHFQGMRYLDLTLAAYVGEAVTIRYDPRDLAEVRVFHRDRFLCRAVCAELAGETIGLKDLIRARRQRRRELRGTLLERERHVAVFIESPVQPTVEGPDHEPPTPPDGSARLKRYVDD